MTNSAQAAKAVDNRDLWADGFASNRYPSAESACQGNANWINSHPSYGYRVSLASITAPTSPTGRWSCLYAGTLLEGNVQMPFPAANISIYRYYRCPANAHIISASSNQMTGGACDCNVNFHADAAGKNCEPDILTLTLSNAPAGNVVTLASQPMSLQVTNNATPPDLNTATYIRVEISQPSVNGGTAIPARLTGCPIVSNSGTTSVYNCYTGYPDGYLNGIAKFGYANFNYTAPSVPGSYTLTATCTKPLCANSQSATINVVCPAGTQLNAAGTACVVGEQYTIALSGLGGEVMSNATRSAYAQVTKKSDGSLKSGAQVALSLTVVSDSGSPTDPSNVGHLSLTSGLTGANGRLPFVFTAPLAGGTHTITAKCTNCTNEATGTIKVLGCPVGDLTDIPTLSALAGETPEQTQLTQDLEGGMDGYSLLSPATQTAEQCLADKINATPVSGYKVTSTVRTVAYQQHLRNVWNKFADLKSRVESDPSIQQRCQTLITKVEGEIGFRLTQDPTNENEACNTALGRAHCVRHEPAGANPKHTQNIAFDIPLTTVTGYKKWLRQQTTPNTVGQEASTCGLAWGDSFGDPIHFFLLQ